MPACVCAHTQMNNPKWEEGGDSTVMLLTYLCTKLDKKLKQEIMTYSPVASEHHSLFLQQELLREGLALL